jgi:hypothetical protein
VLLSVLALELGSHAQDLLTIDFITSISNVATTSASIMYTQLLPVFKAAPCSFDVCQDSSVPVTSPSAFQDSDGPMRFTWVCCTVSAVAFISMIAFSTYVPASKVLCDDMRSRASYRPSTTQKFGVLIVLSIILVSDFSV